MNHIDSIQTVYAELEVGTQLSKCQQCGCLEVTLENFASLLPGIDANEARALLQTTFDWKRYLKSVRYPCLGCEHCYPAVAQQALTVAFPDIDKTLPLDCDFQSSEDSWPPIPGEYFVLDYAAPVAVSTLASVHLAEDLAQQSPPGLAIVGKTETENIGIDKIVKNSITKPSLRYLILAGQETEGHQTGQTLLALVKNGVDAEGRIIDAPGKRPFLRNVTADEINTFRHHIEVIDMIGCDRPDEIKKRIKELAVQSAVPCGCRNGNGHGSLEALELTVPTVVVPHTNGAVTLDKAGYFVIVPLPDKNLINVEHYAYDHTLLRVVKGEEGKALYKYIIANGWVSDLSHAAYLGRELAKAELSLQHGFKYVQDGA